MTAIQPMDKFSLSDLEKLTGIKSDTIRIWESRYGIMEPHRTDTKRRWYTNEDLMRLINISVLYNNGGKISRIAKLSVKDAASRAAEIMETGSTSKSVIDSLVVATLRFDEPVLNEILLRTIIKDGFEDTFLTVVFPFLRRVGVLWHTGSLSASSEHFVTNLFRQHLLIAIHDLPVSTNPEPRRFLMFLPDNEYHELGILFYRYIIKKAGHEILYLGQSTPLNSIENAISAWKPNYIVTGVNSVVSLSDPVEFLKEISTLFSEGKILIAGILADMDLPKNTSNIYKVKGIIELKQYL